MMDDATRPVAWIDPEYTPGKPYGKHTSPVNTFEVNGWMPLVLAAPPKKGSWEDVFGHLGTPEEVAAEWTRMKDALAAAQSVATFRPYENDNGEHIGWYVNTPEVYCDIERDANGHWSIFFRDWIDKKETYAVAPRDAAPAMVLDIHLNEDAADTLRQTIGDEAAPIRLQYGPGHSGHGLYVSHGDYSEEGSILLTVIDALAAPRDAADELARGTPYTTLSEANERIYRLEKALAARDAKPAQGDESLRQFIERAVRDRTELAHNGGGKYNFENDRLLAQVRANLVAARDAAQPPAGFKLIAVNAGFEPLMEALVRAERKGYMPDAMTHEWEAFDWSVARDAAQQPSAPDDGGDT